MKDSVLLDTSFFVRIIEPDGPLQRQSVEYFNFFKLQDYELVISTISIAEYCVKGRFGDLPYSELKVLPFKLIHTEKAGAFAAQVFAARNLGNIQLPQRQIIPNDTKLFAQAETEPQIKYYLTSDIRSLKIYQTLSRENPLNFQFIDLNAPLTDFN